MTNALEMLKVDGKGAHVEVKSPSHVVIKVDAQCEITLTEKHTRASAENRLMCELFLAPQSRVHHFQIVDVDSTQEQFFEFSVHQSTNTFYKRVQYAKGSKALQNNVHVMLEGNGAECELYGLDVGKDTEDIKTQLLVEHVGPHTQSKQVHKGIFDGHSKGLFDGKVKVAQSAAHTNASQMNRNLLLSKDAAAYAQPHLEIDTDEVKCSHGATIGQLDEAALFYLRARGLPLAQARELLTQAFAAEIIDLIPPSLLGAHHGA